MKVTIIKGPHFEERQKKAYELIYHILSKKVADENIQDKSPNKEAI